MSEGGDWTAERVARLRRAMGLTQGAFARELGVRQQTVSEWETGQYRPRGASVRLLGMLAERRTPYDKLTVDGEEKDRREAEPPGDGPNAPEKATERRSDSA